MNYERSYIDERDVPKAAAPIFQHVVDTYASETNKTAAVWHMFTNDDLSWRPHPRSATVQEIMKHHLLSERRFFGEFLGHPEPAPSELIPAEPTVDAFIGRLVELAAPRLSWLCAVTESQWVETANFFDVKREKIWIFWRRVLHSAHHRTQLTVSLRLLGRSVPPVYGPTADVTWSGADPTRTVDAAGRR